MAISFDGIGQPRVPWAYIEFSNASASQGPSVQPYKVLAMGQKLSAGTEPELTLKTVTSEAQAITLYGRGSQVHRMVKCYLANNLVTELQVVAIDDLAAGVAAAGKITVPASTASLSGILAIYIAGQRVLVPVTATEDQDAIAAQIAAQIALLPDLPVTAAVDGTNANEVNLTAKNKGLVGNEIDVRVGYRSDDVLPSGVAEPVITAMASGAGNPDVAEIISVLPEDQFNLIINPWTDATSLDLLEAELSGRFGPQKQNDGT